MVRCGWLVVAGWLLGGQVALAQQDLEVGVNATAPVGKLPELVLRANRATRNVKVELKRNDGHAQSYNTGKMKPGQEKKVPLQQAPGDASWEGTLTATYPDVDEPATMPLTFKTSVLAPPQLALAPQGLQLTEHRLNVTLNRACHHLSFTVYGDDGSVIDKGDSQFNGAPAGEVLPVTWNPTDATVIRIDVVGHDPNGMFSPTLSLFPWTLDIPHQDVNFPSGQSVIPAAEQPKVAEAAEDIRTALKRYGKLVDVKLFIGGYTDTVGGADGNLTLSQARAEAIGRALRKAGVKAPIYCQGFGEGSLKVPTPDETDNADNRRATYTLGVDIPGSGWTRL